MEDAMVINRGSLQRGFAHGQVYKSDIIDLKEMKSSAMVSTLVCFPFFASFLISYY
jgi:DNA-directed RNA polymerase I subunit RPA2